MEWKAELQGSDSLNGRVARTLHLTPDGHKDTGCLVVKFVSEHYKPAPVSLAPDETSTPLSTITLDPCPAGLHL